MRVIRSESSPISSCISARRPPICRCMSRSWALVSFCPGADLLLHVEKLGAGLVLQVANLFLYVEELAAQRGEPERAAREHRSEHGHEHRDEESFGSGERVVGTPTGAGETLRFSARHRLPRRVLRLSIGLVGRLGQWCCRVVLQLRDAFVRGEVLHHVQT